MTKSIILCEDIDQDRFIRQYLICRGVRKRDINNYPKVQRNKVENNNASILKDYPKLVKSYRSKKYQDLAIVVMIDADDKSITWFSYINGNLDCNETTDYKDSSMETGERIQLTQNAAKKLATEICLQRLDNKAPDSLKDACQELQRLGLI